MVCEIILLFFFDVGAKNQRKRKKVPFLPHFWRWNTQFFVVFARTLKGEFCKRGGKERCFYVLLRHLFVSFPSDARGEAMVAKKTTRRFMQNKPSFLVKPHVVFRTPYCPHFQYIRFVREKRKNTLSFRAFFLLLPLSSAGKGMVLSLESKK